MKVWVVAVAVWGHPYASVYATKEGAIKCYKEAKIDLFDVSEPIEVEVVP